MKKTLTILSHLGLMALFGMLLLRSGLFAWRVMSELQLEIKPATVSTLNLCLPFPSAGSQAEFYRYSYAKLGVDCD